MFFRVTKSPWCRGQRSEVRGQGPGARGQGAVGRSCFVGSCDVDRREKVGALLRSRNARCLRTHAQTPLHPTVSALSSARPAAVAAQAADHVVSFCPMIGHATTAHGFGITLRARAAPGTPRAPSCRPARTPTTRGKATPQYGCRLRHFGTRPAGSVRRFYSGVIHDLGLSTASEGDRAACW
jgi:hypothetical protein